MWCTFILLTFFVTVQGRAVNISNTWVLPEEGFPVFYRYFRDRISWYEADAVCQFHHANLVTVDTTAQYDAVRAYLKELDISSAVWVGLIRSNPDGDFTWTDYRGLSGDGYWSAAPDSRAAPLCAAADPASDYRWEARACGGPSVASFICELPVPQWALGNEGCMVRALPALTILYLPESAAVQLTADCGLAGVKRVQCTGNMKREDLLKELSCTVEEQGTTLASNTAPNVTWEATTDVTFTDQEVINESSPDDIATTEHDENLNHSISIESTPIFQNSIMYVPDKFTAKNSINDKQNNGISNGESKVPEILDNNNLFSNEISKHGINEDIMANEQRQKEEDEKNLQHKKLHDELARLGNFETIFSQTTDHFVPPLVMAKAKMSDDMIALSIEEKLAQQIADHQFSKHVHDISIDSVNHTNALNITNDTKEIVVTSNDVQLNESDKMETSTVNTNKNIIKNITPKKYNKYDDVKGNTIKKIGNSKQGKILKSIKTTYVETTTVMDEIINVNTSIKHNVNSTLDDTSLELSVILKEPEQNLKNPQPYVIKIENENVSSDSGSDKDTTTKQNLPMNDEVIKIVLFKNNNHSYITPVTFEITTKVPTFENKKTEHEDFNNSEKHDVSVTAMHNANISESNSYTKVTPLSLSTLPFILSTSETTVTSNIVNPLTTTESQLSQNIVFNLTNENKINNTNGEISTIQTIDDKNTHINKTEWYEQLDKNYTNFDTETTEFDDFQSPLLSAANEPIHKPIRARRPQSSLNRAKKFNPFRILG